jgi:ankyrin repeat protein
MLLFIRQQGSVTCAQQLIAYIGKEVYGQQRARDPIQDRAKEIDPSFLDDDSISKWLDYRKMSWSDSYKTTGLHLAILLRLDDIATEILAEQDSTCLSAINGLDETPLHLAVVCSCEELISQLVRRGSDLDARDRLGMAPWHTAAACGNASALRILRLAVNRAQFNAQAELSASQQSAGAIENTESAWITRTVSGSTALHFAARNGHLESVKLIMADYRCDWTIEDRYGMTAFHKACKYGRLEIVRHFVTCTPCAEYRSTKDGRIGLHLACKYESGFEVATFLMQRQPELCSIRDNRYETALHHAAAGLDSRAVKLLLDQPSVDVNASNCKGKTPTMLAAFNPNDGFEMLLKHEALDRNIQVGLWSIDELANKRAAVAHSRNETALVHSSLHDRAVELTYLAHSLSEDGMRSLTPGIQ